MKTIARCLAFLVLTASSYAAAIPLFNTGVDASRIPLVGGAADPHYDVLSTGADARVLTSPAGSYVDGNYAVLPSVSRYIWVNETASPAGTFTFRTTFDMTGLSLASAVINGRWAVDNAGLDIVINGVSTGQITPNPFGHVAWTAFSISAANLVSGINTLDFVAQDQGSPGAFRAEFLTATANLSTPPPTGVPDAGNTLLLLGASVLVLLRANRKVFLRRN